MEPPASSEWGFLAVGSRVATGQILFPSQSFGVSTTLCSDCVAVPSDMWRASVVPDFGWAVGAVCSERACAVEHPVVRHGALLRRRKYFRTDDMRRLVAGVTGSVVPQTPGITRFSQMDTSCSLRRT